MRVVVTGGAGFIGHHLTRHAVSSGDETYVIDNFSSGSPEAVPSGAEIVEADIRDEGIRDVLLSIDPQVVIHAAAQVSVSRSMSEPALDREVNLAGTEHVLEGARRAQRFVFLSTGGAIYGDATAAAEDHLPAPASYYGIHKWAAERYIAASGLSCAVARLANVYGPGQRADLEGGVVSIFCDRARGGSPLTIYGDGDQRRDFVHVDDVVGAIFRMAASQGSGTWNVGSGIATSINELADLIESVVRQPLKREYLPERPGELKISCLDITLAQTQLGWNPKVSLGEGVRALL